MADLSTADFIDIHRPMCKESMMPATGITEGVLEMQKSEANICIGICEFHNENVPLFTG